MGILVLGLVLFLGIHSTRLFAPQWRLSMIDRLGANGWKGVYSILSIVGFVLLIWGYGQARMTVSWLWVPPTGLKHLATLLTIPAFILLAAAYVPGTKLKAKLGHPMVLAVKTWALAHLLSNGSWADIVLFGGFLLWAIPLYAVSRRRDRSAGVSYPAVSGTRDIIAVVVGLVAWAVFAFYLHGVLIGVRPFG
ncbi:MAG: NnrU family protein [Saccharospirillum sp.]